jgi:UDP-3-O-[3-hydroxymyristoyl] glucosamine N-acyltransferase
MGNVVIEDDVDIEALTVVHRAGMTSTVLKKGVKICVKCNIAHNCIIGENTFIASGALIGGGTVIGKNCYVWQGAIIRDNISICDNVIIGSGSMVMQKIENSGVYFGTPARYIKPYDPSLR